MGNHHHHKLTDGCTCSCQELVRSRVSRLTLFLNRLRGKAKKLEQRRQGKKIQKGTQLSLILVYIFSFPHVDFGRYFFQNSSWCACIFCNFRFLTIWFSEYPWSEPVWRADFLPYLAFSCVQLQYSTYIAMHFESRGGNALQEEMNNWIGYFKIKKKFLP